MVAVRLTSQISDSAERGGNYGDGRERVEDIGYIILIKCLKKRTKQSPDT